MKLVVEVQEKRSVRGGDDDLSVDQFLIKGRVLALLVGCCHEAMSLIFEPFADPKFVFGGAEKLWDFSGMLFALSIAD